MKIDSDFINKIFNFKIKLKKDDDKIKLSKYEDFIPMYDIYSQHIYPINKKNIHYRLIESHYRFINKEIHDWIKKLYIKNKNDPILGQCFNNILKILDNYNIGVSIIMPGFVISKMSKASNYKNFSMMKAEKAAYLIKEGIAKKKDYIIFPKISFILLKLFSVLPFFIKKYLIKQFMNKEY